MNPAQAMNNSMDMNNSDNSTMMMMNMNMMQMSFYWGKDAVILFSGWPKHSLGMYILAFFFVFLLAFALEFLSRSPPDNLNNTPIVGGFMQAIIHAFRTALTYLVMLAVMSFNVGIFIAAVAGHTLGFFFVKTRALALAKRTADPKV